MGSGVSSWPRELRWRHGRLLGLAQSAVGAFSHRLGLLGRLEAVELARVRRCVFVCRGNICRSAYARARAAQLGIPSASFGLHARAGAPADAVATEIAAARGVDLSGHFAISASQIDLDAGDLVLAMEPTQLFELRRSRAQRSLLGLWAKRPRVHLHDPFGLDRAYFETCFSIIDSAIQALAAKLEGAR